MIQVNEKLESIWLRFFVGRPRSYFIPCGWRPLKPIRAKQDS